MVMGAEGDDGYVHTGSEGGMKVGVRWLLVAEIWQVLRKEEGCQTPAHTIP